MLLRPVETLGRRAVAARICGIYASAGAAAGRHRTLAQEIMKIAVRKRRAPSIIIVSLVDILTILLIFLRRLHDLQKGSAGGADQSSGIANGDEGARRAGSCNRQRG